MQTVEIVENQNEVVAVVISNIAKEVIANVRGAIERSPTKVAFAAINNYENADNEVSSRIINIGISYERMKEKDVKFLQSFDVVAAKEKFGWKSSVVMLETAKAALLAAKLKPTGSTNQGKAQLEAYTTISAGLKVHNETGILYVQGYNVGKKKVLKAGEYGADTRAELTKAKDEIRKVLRSERYRQFKLTIGKENSLKCNGNCIEF